MASQTQRANRAARLIQTYPGETRSDLNLAVSELLCDIIAWCRRESAAFHDILGRSVQITSSELLDS